MRHNASLNGLGTRCLPRVCAHEYKKGGSAPERNRMEPPLSPESIATFLSASDADVQSLHGVEPFRLRVREIGVVPYWFHKCETESAQGLSSRSGDAFTDSDEFLPTASVKQEVSTPLPGLLYNHSYAIFVCQACKTIAPMSMGPLRLHLEKHGLVYSIDQLFKAGQIDYLFDAKHGMAAVEGVPVQAGFVCAESGCGAMSMTHGDMEEHLRARSHGVRWNFAVVQQLLVRDLYVVVRVVV